MVLYAVRLGTASLSLYWPSIVGANRTDFKSANTNTLIKSARREQARALAGQPPSGGGGGVRDSKSPIVQIRAPKGIYVSHQ